MKKETAYKLTSDLIADEEMKFSEYIERTVSLILDKIKERIQLGHYEMKIQYYDFTDHVRLSQHKEQIFDSAINILIKDYNYWAKNDRSDVKNFTKISWH